MTRTNLAAAVQRPRPGVAAVEFALVLPFLLIFLLGMWEVGRLIEVQQIMTNAAREGARQAAAGQLAPAAITTLVQQYLTNQGLQATNVTVAVKNLGFSGNPSPTGDDPRQATDLDQLQVTVTVPFKDVRWTTLRLVTDASTNLKAQATWSSMKDRSFEIPSPPTGF
jgi:Flp pilus assembly protein TadG